MSKEEKLELLLSALQIMAVSTSDVLTSRYCVTMLIEVGEVDRLEEMYSFANSDLEPTKS